MENQVLRGDCFDILPTLPQRCVQTVFVDPPYNIGIDYGRGGRADRLPAAQYVARMKRLAQLCVERLRPNGSLWFLISESWADQIGDAFEQP